MKKITQTGHIPVGSIGLIFGKYLKWFKVFFVFYFIPLVISWFAHFLINREKILLVIRNFKESFLAIQAKNPVLLEAAKTSLDNSLTSLSTSPKAFIINVIFAIVMLVCGTCLVVGAKHTFYKEISISEIAKEGFSKVVDLLWTGISMVLMVLLTIIGGIIIFALPTAILGQGSIILIIPIFIAILIGYSMFVFYIPIHFFSGNNMVSSALFSCKTFWSSFAFILVALLLSVFISSLFMGIVFGLGFVSAFVLHNNIMIALSAILFALVSSYTGCMGIGLSAIAIFVAYPELLEEDKIDTGTTVISEINEATISIPEHFSGNQNTMGSVTFGSNAGEGLSVPNSHKNDRPFLNQKPDQTEFDRWTSKE